MKDILERIDGMRVNAHPADAGKLKYFAALIMLIDHMACVFLENARTADGNALMYSLVQGKLIDSILRAVGRQAFPIFCFFLVEGFMKTRSRVKYFLRLIVFAILSQFPFQKAIFPRSQHFHGSVMCTLAIGLLAVWVIDAMKKAFLENNPREDAERDAGRGKSGTDQGAGLSGAADSSRLFYTGLFLFVCSSSVYGLLRLAYELRTDYSYGGVLMIILMYVLQKYRIPALFISWAWLSWYNNLELYSAPAFLMLAGYNGERGKQNKYFFYLFYPAHLLILWLVRRSIFGI